MSNTATITVQVNNVVVTGTVAEVTALVQTLGGAEVGTQGRIVVQQPKAEAKAAPKVNRIIESAKLTETTLDSAAVGSVVQLTATGAQYRVVAKGAESVLLGHPKGEFQYPASRVVFAVR